MTSDRTPLESQLARRIELEGPVTFRDFMQAALYDREHGYYNTERLKIGPQGDFYTSSNVHSAFGAVLARAFRQLHPEEPLTLVEMGAGTGQLASDILASLEAASLESVRYVIVETSPAMRRRQRERLGRFSGRVEWREPFALMKEDEALTGIVFSNELVDAFPVHRVRAVGGRLEEMYLTATSGKLEAFWGLPSTARLQDYLDRCGVKIAENQAAEINLDAVEWLETVSRMLKRGYLVTIDYGDLAPHLYAGDRREGTLRAFSRHTVTDAIFERVGEQDLTASVNFTALIEYGKDFGFEPVSYERQTSFLLRSGLIEIIAGMETASGGTVDDLKERLAIKNLFVPGGVSDNFRVLVQRKG
ncbi:MAG TPA: SAM-dependent methyltransferase [Blastocatellia bacterium]|nr:SAM-dependent methyltransferase [Blastocatellia bacterium]